MEQRRWHEEASGWTRIEGNDLNRCSVSFVRGLENETDKHYPLRLPASLKAALAEISRAEGTSMNQFVAVAVAEKISAMRTAEFFAGGAMRRAWRRRWGSCGARGASRRMATMRWTLTRAAASLGLRGRVVTRSPDGNADEDVRAPPRVRRLRVRGRPRPIHRVGR